MTQATVVRYPKGSMFFDNTGRPLAGGCLWYFQAGTSTPQSVYLDATGNTVFSSGSVNGVPYVQLNSAGRLESPVYLGPTHDYKELLTDYTGATSGPVGANTIAPWPEDNIPAAPSSSSSATQQVLTGTLCPYVGTVAPSGYVLSSGKSIGNPSSSASARANSDTQALFVLMWNADLTNTHFVVSGGRGSSALTDFSANKTITLPDLRGRVVMGLDNMGGTAAGRLTGSVAGTIPTPTAIGSSGGEEVHLLTVAESASHGHVVNQSTHNLTVTIPNGPGSTNYGTSLTGTAAPQTFNVSPFTTAISLVNTGGDTSHNNLPPGIVLNVLIKL